MRFARFTSAPTLPRFTTPDPHAESTPSISPYAYCAGNPVMYTDPAGCDSIYIFEKNTFRAIGYTNATDPNRYYVRGSVEKAVRGAVEKEEVISPMQNSKDVVILPPKSVLDAAEQSMHEANERGTEEGGHMEYGSETIYRWDSGEGPNGERNSINAFRIDSHYRINAANTATYWHVHPRLRNFEISGYATPSSGDIDWDKNMRRYGYMGTTFLVGGQGGRINFYWKDKQVLKTSFEQLSKIYR